MQHQPAGRPMCSATPTSNLYSYFAFSPLQVMNLGLDEIGMERGGIVHLLPEGLILII